MNQTTVVLKLLNGIYQLTKLNLKVAPDGSVLQPLNINAPVFGPDGRVERTCKAFFYKKNSRNTWFYKEKEPAKEDMHRFV